MELTAGLGDGDGGAGEGLGDAGVGEGEGEGLGEGLAQLGSGGLTWMSDGGSSASTAKQNKQ